MPTAVFAGITTLDIAYQVERYPNEDTKNLAERQFTGAGGPAANAAITFAALGGSARLVTAVGSSAVAQLAVNDIKAAGVEVVDAAPQLSAPLPISSIISATDHRSRTIVSRDEAGIAVAALDDPPLADASIVLIDGHHPELGRSVAQAARARGVPVVLDAGRWKQVHVTLLPHVDIAICAADFRPPQTDDVFGYLSDFGVAYGAITNGDKHIQCSTGAVIPVGRGDVVDTLGAGDILHGAFCWFYAQGNDFAQALRLASAVATKSCEYFGTREWIGHIDEIDYPVG